MPATGMTDMPAHGYTPFLRYTGENPEVTRMMLNADLAALAAVPRGDEARLRVVGRIGEGYRMLRRETEALPYLEEAVVLAQRLGNRPARAANLIRQATAHQYLGRHNEAESEFREALQLCAEPGCTGYEDFAWQHLGKCLVEIGRIGEGIDCFKRALARRRAKGDPGLLASTEEVLSAAHALLPAEDERATGRASLTMGEKG
jgi:tetratricopeptide (TPR) repeat protein